MENLDSTPKYIEFYLEKLRQGDFEPAFHALTEVGHSVIPRLIDAFRTERLPSVRAELVTIIWNHRRPETIAFLGDALQDVEPAIWKNALDGLVTLASPAALHILQSALEREIGAQNKKKDFQAWLGEAIGQVREAMANQLPRQD